LINLQQSHNADHIVAGGQPHGLSPTANIIKECEEEASIPLELARTLKPVGAVSYTTSRCEGGMTFIRIESECSGAKIVS